MAKPIKPITPAEVTKKKQAAIPDEVLAAFNELIAKAWDGSTATVLQDDAVKLIAAKMNVKASEIYSNHWLDVEPLYRKAGWTVTYDKPGYCESYAATFAFRPRRKVP